MIGVHLKQWQIDFIILKKGKMKQKEIAAELNVTPACVCKVLKRSNASDEYFDIDKFSKQYAA